MMLRRLTAKQPFNVCRTAFHSAAACYQTLRGVYSTGKGPGASAAAVNVTDLNPPIVARKLGKKMVALLFPPSCLPMFVSSITPPLWALGYDDTACQPRRRQKQV